MNVVVKHTSTN